MLAEQIRTYTAGFDHTVAAVVSSAIHRVPSLRGRLSAAGLLSVRTVDELSRIPVLTKDELVAAQRADLPFGGTVASDVVPQKIFASPGPLYEPQLPGPDPWRWGQALRALGLRPGDIVLNCMSYHLSPAGAMMERGALEIGATVVPAGVGNQELQVGIAAELGATAFIGLPSYLDALIGKADTAGLDFPVRRALVTAEPLPDALRARITTRVPTVLAAYGTAEAGLLGYETAPDSDLTVADGVLIQVCDTDTGAPRLDGEVGQVVITLLRPEQPLVRFGTGDLSAWRPGPDGVPRLAGVLGRVGEAVKVRGMFLHPRQAAAAMAKEDGVARYRFIVDQIDHRDVLRCEVVTDGDGTAVAARVRERIRAELRLTADVTCVDSLPDDRLVVDRRAR